MKRSLKIKIEMKIESLEMKIEIDERYLSMAQSFDESRAHGIVLLTHTVSEVPKDCILTLICVCFADKQTKWKINNDF